MRTQDRQKMDAGGLEHLVHDLTIRHPYLTVEDITSRLLGEDRLTSKTKSLYRRLNPNDEKLILNIRHLEKLIDVLNEVCRDEDTLDTMGGCSIVHFLAARAGMVAARLVDRSKGSQEMEKALRRTLKTLHAFAGRALDYRAGEPGPILDKNDFYKVHSELLRLERSIEGAAGEVR